MALVIIFSSILAFSQTCPSERELPSLPVHDQDGLGTCASNTAALMMQHNLSLNESPSYVQLSLTHSGLRRNSLFFTDDSNSQRLFNWGAAVCDVVNDAETHGYCDHSLLGVDSIGAEDNERRQSRFLNDLATFLNSNEVSMQDLRERISDPLLRSRASGTLAQHFLDRREICVDEFSRFVAQRTLERFIQWLRSSIPDIPLHERGRYEAFLRGLTDEEGAPSDIVINAFRSLFHQEAKPLLEAFNRRNYDLSHLNLPSERQIVEAFMRVGNYNNFTFDLPYNNFFQSDIDAYSICRDNEQISSYRILNGDLTCQAQVDQSQLTSFTSDVENILGGIRSFTESGVDPEAGLVNLISPSCAVQMTQRQSQDFSCSEEAIKNAEGARAAKSRIYQELCRNRAVGISLCTGHWRSETVVDSGFCQNDVAGVENHGRHAVTLVGYRTVGERKQIKIQNSWGLSCPFLQTSTNSIRPAFEGLVECEMDEENMPTGRFWVDEDLLINNSYRISVM